MKLALMIESDGPGGAEFMLIHLADELRRRGHQVLPIGPEVGYGWLAEQLRDRGFEPASFRLRWPLDPLCLIGLARLFRHHAIEVLHAHEFTMAVYGAAAAALLQRPQVITMHGGLYFAAKRRRREALRWACRRSHSVVAVSSATRDALCRSLDIALSEVAVIPNGVPVISADPLPVRSELGVQRGEVLIVAVGNLYPVKGHRFLLEACANLSARRPDLPWRLAIAGRGEEEDALREQARRTGIADRVHLLGYRDDVPALLAAADVFAMPSLSEGLPLAILEAMRAGKPILASAVGGIPEALEAGREGLLTPPGAVDALTGDLIRLLEDEALRERIAGAAQARAIANHSVESMTDAYEALYMRGLE